MPPRRATRDDAALVRPMLEALPNPPHYPDATLGDALEGGYWYVDTERGTACQIAEQRGGIEVIHWLPRAAWEDDNRVSLGPVLLYALNDLVRREGRAVNLPLFGEFVGPNEDERGRKLSDEESSRYAEDVCIAHRDAFAPLGATVIVEPAVSKRAMRGRSTVREVRAALRKVFPRG